MTAPLSAPSVRRRLAVVAVCSLLGYIADGFTGNGYIGLGVGIATLALTMAAISTRVTSAEK